MLKRFEQYEDGELAIFGIIITVIMCVAVGVIVYFGVTKLF